MGGPLGNPGFWFLHSTVLWRVLLWTGFRLSETEPRIHILYCSNLQENVSPRDLAQRGVCILKLRIASQHTGLYGRSVLNLEPYWPGADLPSHKFTPGKWSRAIGHATLWPLLALLFWGSICCVKVTVTPLKIDSMYPESNTGWANVGLNYIAVWVVYPTPWRMGTHKWNLWVPILQWVG